MKFFSFFSCKSYLKFFSFWFVFLHISVFPTTNILFSNNSSYNYHTTSVLLDSQTNLTPEKDYRSTNNLAVNPFYSNANTLSFNSNINIKNGREYHFRVSIQNDAYPNQILNFYITTRGLFTGSKIIETKIVLPSGEEIVLNPKERSFFFVSEWNDVVFHFVPFEQSESSVWWPSYVLTADQSNEFSFNSSAANTFKGITYNIQLFPFYMDLSTPPNNKKERATNIPQLIGIEYDYVSLNEVLDRDLRTQIINTMKKNYPYYVDAPGMSGANILSGGIVTFSKWPILDVKQMVYQNAYLPDSLSNKGVTYIKINKVDKKGRGQIYNIFSTHLQSTLDPNKKAFEQPRTKQIQELRNFILAQNIPANEPVIIAGDLNIDKYDRKLANYGDGNLKTEYEYLLTTLNATSPVQTGLPYSFDGVLNTMLSLSENTRNQLDYILYLNDHMQPINALNHVQTLRDILNPKMYPIYDTSDHFPVIGAFVF